MTDKQIIIDGYNLEYIKELLYNGQRSAISTNIFEAIIEELERKEQECEELKENLPNAITRLMGELDQLKTENKELKRLIAKQKNAKIQLSKLKDKQYKEFCDMKQTLTEIKEIAEFYNNSNMDNICYQDGIYEILQKISECEGNDE